MPVVRSANWFISLVVLSVELLPVDAASGAEDTYAGNSTPRSVDPDLSGNVSWWAESVSLALGDLTARALGHDQLQQLYDNSVCMTSLSSDDVNVSQRVVDVAAAFGRLVQLRRQVDVVGAAWSLS